MGAWREAATTLLAVSTALRTLGLVTGPLRGGDLTPWCKVPWDRDTAAFGVVSEDSPVPLSSRCAWADGRAVEFVPWYVDPGVTAPLGGAALTAAAAWRKSSGADGGADHPSVPPAS